MLKHWGERHIRGKGNLGGKKKNVGRTCKKSPNRTVIEIRKGPRRGGGGGVKRGRLGSLLNLGEDQGGGGRKRRGSGKKSQVEGGEGKKKSYEKGNRK